MKELLRQRRELIGEFDTPAEIHTEIDRLLGRLHQLEPNTITIIDRGNPMHGSGTGNP